MPSPQLLSPSGQHAIDAFVRLCAHAPARFNTSISPEDEMYLYLLHKSKSGDHDESHLRYFESGKAMLEEYRGVIDAAFGSFPAVESVLEFACGHGRFTRFLVQEVAPENIVVADIYADAVAFQEAQFGVTGRVSVADPNDYLDDRRYQLILVSSLFSHLPADTFTRWLKRLYELLTHDGVLIFSVHDEAVMPPGLSLDDRGFAFVAQSESRSLDPMQYGSTFVSERFVGSAIEEACPDSGGYVRVPRWLWKFQDLYLVPRGGVRDVSKVGPRQGPIGYLEKVRWRKPFPFYVLEGWAFDFDKGESIERVEVRLGGQLEQVCLPNLPRQDVADHYNDPRALYSGWTCVLAPNRLDPDTVVSIELISTSQRKAVVAFDTFEHLRGAYC